MQRMPFGKYKDLRLEDLPDAYLHWLHALDTLREPLRSAVAAEHARRTGTETAPRVGTSACLELISAGLHALTRRHHPDAGGDHTRMVQINLAAHWLREQAKRAEVA